MFHVCIYLKHSKLLKVYNKTKLSMFLSFYNTTFRTTFPPSQIIVLPPTKSPSHKSNYGFDYDNGQCHLHKITTKHRNFNTYYSAICRRQSLSLSLSARNLLQTTKFYTFFSIYSFVFVVFGVFFSLNLRQWIGLATTLALCYHIVGAAATAAVVWCVLSSNRKTEKLTHKTCQ